MMISGADTFCLATTFIAFRSTKEKHMGGERGVTRQAD